MSAKCQKPALAAPVGTLLATGATTIGLIYCCACAIDAGWRAENFSTMHIRESDKRTATGLDKFPAGYTRPRSRERPGPFVVFTLFQANTVLSEINSKLDACLSRIYFLVERPRRRA
jgi:hypothetical protein